MADAVEIDRQRPGAALPGDRIAESIEGRSSWSAAGLALAILSIAYGAPLVVVVGLRPIAAALANDEAKALLGIEPLHGAGFLDRCFKRRAARRLIGRTPRRRRTAVDAKYFGDLRTFLSRCDAKFERLARLHRADAAALEHAGVEEGIARPVREFDKPEPSLGLEPFDGGPNRRTGRRLEARCAVAGRAAEFPQVRVVTIIVKIPPARLTKIPVSDQRRFPIRGGLRAIGDRRQSLFQKIASDASG